MLTSETKVKLFTHNDLDGIGCEIVGRLAFDNIDTTIVKNPNDASQKVAQFIENGEFHFYDKIFITDISVDEKTAEMIENLEWESHRFALLDHHPTADYLNKYDWASVYPVGAIGKQAGTNMFFKHLDMNGLFDDKLYKDALTVFVEKVRRYDSWEWKDIYDDTEASALNQLLYLRGQQAFTERYVRALKYGDVFAVREGSWTKMFNDTDRAILEIDNAKKDAYIDRKEKQMIRTNLLGFKMGLVFAEQYTSELGNVLSERNQDLKFIVMVDMGSNKISYRTTHDDINLGKEVANVFGGGGHPKASGSEFSKGISILVFKLIFGVGLFGKLGKFLDKDGKK
jgi:uncharacterized protein